MQSVKVSKSFCQVLRRVPRREPAGLYRAVTKISRDQGFFCQTVVPSVAWFQIDRRQIDATSQTAIVKNLNPSTPVLSSTGCSEKAVYAGILIRRRFSPYQAVAPD